MGARFTLAGAPGVLVTAHDAAKAWDGQPVPVATFDELKAFSDAALAAGALGVFRPYVEDGCLHLYFPCDEGCTTASDYVYLDDGEHAHWDEMWFSGEVGQDVPVAVEVENLRWRLAKDGNARR